MSFSNMDHQVSTIILVNLSIPALRTCLTLKPRAYWGSCRAMVSKRGDGPFGAALMIA